MSVIDARLRISQHAFMLSYDEIIAQLLPVLKIRGKQAELAKKLGIAPSRLSELKRGDYRIQQEDIHKVAEFLGDGGASPLDPPQPWLPSEATLQVIIRALSNALPEGRFHVADAPRFAHAWRAALEYFAADRDREHNEDYQAGVVPTINRALRDYTQRHEQAA